MEANCVLSDGDGRYELEGIPAGELVVAAGARQHLPTTLPREGQTPLRIRSGEERTLDITLVRGGVLIEGIVLDVTGGVIEGAWVKAHEETILDPFRLFGSATSPMTMTDENGRFTLWVKPGPVLLSASASGYGFAHGGGEAPARGVELRLAPESIVFGQVVDENDDPVAGARVDVGEDVVYDGTSLTTFTGIDGRFRLAGLPPGSYRPNAVDSRGRGVSDVTVHVGPGESAEVIIRLAEGQPVTTRVTVGEKSVPCERGRVVASHSDGAKFGAPIEGDGVAVLKGLPRGRYQPSVYCESGRQSANLSTFEVDTEPVSLELNVPAGHELPGVVLDPSGKPVPDALVVARGMDSRRARSSEDGTFRLLGLAPGVHEIVASRVGMAASDAIRVATEDEPREIELRLRRGAEVRVTVRTRDGEHHREQRVRVHGNESRRSFYCSTDHRGTCVITGLEAGVYEVGILEVLVTDSETVTVSLEDGASRSVELLRPARSEQLRGIVFDDDGVPVPDAVIEVMRHDPGMDAVGIRALLTAMQGQVGVGTLTDDDGRFVVQELMPGSYAVRASLPGRGEQTVTGAVPGRGELRIRLAR